jgi:hypothetical protein
VLLAATHIRSPRDTAIRYAATSVRTCRKDFDHRTWGAGGLCPRKRVARSEHRRSHRYPPPVVAEAEPRRQRTEPTRQPPVNRREHPPEQAVARLVSPRPREVEDRACLRRHASPRHQRLERQHQSYQQRLAAAGEQPPGEVLHCGIGSSRQRPASQYSSNAAGSAGHAQGCTCSAVA